MARKINLPETKGEFKLVGLVNGVEKKNYFTEISTRSGKKMNILKFGAKTSEDNNVQVELKGMERNEVFFYRRPKDGEKKGETKKVQWVERNTWKEDGFKLIGINVGVTQKADNEGKLKNDSKTLTEFDACKYIKEYLEDDRSVFIKGGISYSSFKNDDGEIKRSVSFEPNQISLCSKPVVFEEENFNEENSFKQTIIFMGIEMDDSDKEDKKAVVSAKIVSYNSIENASFVLRNQKLYKTFKKKLRPYTAITVWGKLLNKVIKEEVVVEDEWGEASTFDKPKNTFKREMEITGADPNSIDTDTYSEEKIEEAIRALKEFGEETSVSNNTSVDDDWGTEDNTNSQDNDDDEW